MENMRLRKHNTANSHTPSLALHRDSHMVSKTKPKIRIIHIFAPEIIKTDVENFRELVQKLTGKPSGEKCCKKNKAREKTEAEEYSRSSSSTGGTVMRMKNSNGGCWGLDVTKEKVKEEVGVCSSDESCGGYLGGFTDLEGFISEIGGFPFLPLDANHMMQAFEEPQLL
ncbi:hypothetical protein PHAVU_007G259600 [Phaseolus vulgaris]|uniref:VQ domain-containing protein n=1 Tax=Phaseolus vulgaris TaxID=3885 RepID=V7BKY0_PHAVU|nr:hypothetical protein PHAVU_007G259600g [Phaseolus vulgaris]ESW17678.1 hypothetical protein PHAVU_007G259600g [Phaseolus vulgaris]